MNIKDRFPESDEIWNYSNPVKAQQNAHKFYGENATLYRSKTKNKKYFILTPDNKKVNFGQMSYIDFTKSNDTKKRELFKSRNHKWANQDKYTPGHLSYHLLW